jgi:hypothetical protein
MNSLQKKLSAKKARMKSWQKRHKLSTNYTNGHEKKLLLIHQK